MENTNDLAPIFSAIVKLQRQVQSLEQNAQGGGGKYRYTTLGSILELVLPLLAENGVAVVQPLVSTEDGGFAVQTQFIHTSGVQWTASLVSVPQDGTTLRGGANLVQNQGANITYIRRYALSAALGIASEKDTDGQGQTQGKSSPSHAITPAQKNELLAIARDRGMPIPQAGAILKQFGFASSSEVTSEKFDAVKLAIQTSNIEVTA